MEGCSIVMDGWTNTRNRPLLNIMVTCSKGPHFLKAIEFLHHQLCDDIEEVSASHVVHVVSNAALVCKSVGMCSALNVRLVNSQITPCSPHVPIIHVLVHSYVTA